ncbi:MAG: DNA polymerase III subunit chi, partial [Mangrovicoccus sp.]
MGKALFYELTDSPVEAALALLLGKSLEAGLKVDLRSGDAGRLDWLDQKLWLGAEEGFLPHGMAGGPHDGLQPILLTADLSVRGDTSCLMSVYGAAVSDQELADLERCCILFDGYDEAAKSH